MSLYLNQNSTCIPQFSWPHLRWYRIARLAWNWVFPFLELSWTLIKLFLLKEHHVNSSILRMVWRGHSDGLRWLPVLGSLVFVFCFVLTSDFFSLNLQLRINHGAVSPSSNGVVCSWAFHAGMILCICLSQPCWRSSELIGPTVLGRIAFLFTQLWIHCWGAVATPTLLNSTYVVITLYCIGNNSKKKVGTWSMQTQVSLHGWLIHSCRSHR